MAAGRSNPFGFVNQHNSSINSASSTNFAYGLPSGPALPSASAIPPQPPPRPNRTQGSSLPSYRSSPFGSYGLYNNNSYGGNPYMPYHSNYGMNYGYSGFGTSNSVIDDYNSLYRQVEGSSRQAFQSVESIVQAFTSVSMMLDSTFQALYSSFRAVVGVADNLSRLRSQLYSILSALAIMRTLKYIIRKILEVFRLRPKGHAAAAWQEASVGLLPQQSIFPADSKGLSSWPILMFFGIIVGAPWLIWKLISAKLPGWVTGDDDHYVSYGLYNFVAESNDELSFNAGQKIIIAPKDEQPRLKGWILASVDGKKIGLVPANYIKEPVRCTGRKNILVENTINPVPSRSFSCPTDSQENYGKTVSDKNMEDIFESCHSAPTVT
ncbi:peroxisomal membrane PEX13 [Octopus vulgaris]|uniref:Peroxisomal membrane protein PEX13 n=1 Tax=Octopus vulgaris TaxID=6645 RepID=A0AA36BFT2_OCTVU|nr:peroxisomal membrane PEX13 [Octopus vulgaris]